MHTPFFPAAQPYCGRFAPSPTGALHFGSLVAALASVLEARTQRGKWLVRLEDVDTPRNIPGAAEAILRSLDDFGFEWDGDIMWQSQRRDAYAATLARLRREAWVYACACSRKEIAQVAHAAPDGSMVYPGFCRSGLAPGRQARAWRMRVSDQEIGFVDCLQGPISQNLAREVGDFVLFRADGQYAYQLAVVVDDAEQGVTHIVRGADLLDSTPRQIWLQSCLGLPTPNYAHLPVATDAAGDKLSKQTRAPPLDRRRAAQELRRALAFLGQNPPAELGHLRLAEVWQWALKHWDFSATPRRRAIPA